MCVFVFALVRKNGIVRAPEVKPLINQSINQSLLRRDYERNYDYDYDYVTLNFFALYRRYGLINTN